MRGVSVFSGGVMENANRLAQVGIIVEDGAATDRVNAVLSEFGAFVVGRMGIPYRSRGVSVISVVIDAPAPTVNALTGKLGMVAGVSAKALFSTK